MTNDNQPKLTKLNIETGEEIACTPEEVAAAEQSMRDAIMGLNGMRIEFTPEVLEQLKAKGMSTDELLSMLAESVNGKQ